MLAGRKFAGGIGSAGKTVPELLAATVRLSAA